jgi:outer membrane protein assembly factor BamA
VDRVGFTLQQQIELKKSNIFSYNYTFERNHTFNHNLDSAFHMNTINLAFTRDTRDSLLNATRGMFFSQSIGYAPKIFGSNISFVRYFGQYFTYKRISDFLHYAAGVRIGLGKGVGQDLIPSERFFAGGGTTIRGYAKDEVGPRSLETGDPLGGDAVFILNQELRFPLYKILSGAVFLDIGNVYPRVSDLDPFDVRESAGFGFRLITPFVLLRFDWGFKLDRRPGESLSTIFFSIGQAF